MPGSRLSLDKLFQLARLIAEDETRPQQDLRIRDRAILKDKKSLSEQEKLLLWVKTNANPASVDISIESNLSAFAILFGLLFGSLSLTGLLLVGPSQPVNILLVLGLFLGTQWLILLATLMATLFGLAGRSVQFAGGLLNPLKLALRRLMKRRLKTDHAGYFFDILRWTLLRWGQLMAIAFNVGALLALLLIVSFSDRSFGWGSTLELGTQSVYKFTQILSFPWSHFLPFASVDQSTIEITRFTPLQTEYTLTQLQAMRLWWPFLLCSIIFYGLLPRLLLLPLMHFLYRRCLVQTFTGYPGVNLILTRMQTPLINSRTNAKEESPLTNFNPEKIQALQDQEIAVVINWVNAANKQQQQKLLQHLKLNDDKLMTAGLELDQDRAALSMIQEQAPTQLLLLVKSWEPPLQELNDFLKNIPAPTMVYLLLIPLPGKTISVSEEADWQIFMQTCGRKNSSLLEVETGELS